MAQYLPVLLVSVSAVSSNPAPDDSSLDTQAIGQVDYLSHDWQEEDVAKSWRNMTRRKDSIQNGARLENASWRTWWKQRNHLPTVSPETLNWLKDSDVTWLYGPLHTAADWVPPPRHSPEHEPASTSPTFASMPTSTLRPHSPRGNSPWSLKPILKHRSISELLSISLPPSPAADPMEIEDDQGYFHPHSLRANKTLREAAVSNDSRKRPKLTHTKSDSNMHQRNPFRRESPPLPLASRSRDSSSGDSASGTHTAHRGRHISFNTFVEQCIAIEKPKKALYHDQSFDEHEEEDSRESDDDSEGDPEESEDEVLEMRPTPHSSNRRTPSLSGTSASTWSSFDVSSPEREHVTIAPIAPTMLKTSTSPSPVGSYQFGNIWEEEQVEDEDSLSARAHNDAVNLVYVPPQGSVYAERRSATGKISPPKAEAELRSASFDDAALLQGRPPPAETALYTHFEASFDLLGDADINRALESNPRSSSRIPAQSRDASVGDFVDETHSKSSSGSASEEGTVVPPAASAAIPVPRTHTHSNSSSSTPSPVPSGTSSSSSGGSTYLEPPARGRSTSPITGRERDPPRGRSLSRGSVDGSVSPRSGSHGRLAGRRASTGLGTSPTWRDKSLSPEESGECGVKKGSAARGSGGRDSVGSVSPPNTVREKNDDARGRPPTVERKEEDEADAEATRSMNPTPSNSPTVAVQPLVRASPAEEESVTLVGRAADIVTSARGYLGSFWGAGERLPPATHHQHPDSTGTSIVP